MVKNTFAVYIGGINYTAKTVNPDKFSYVLDETLDECTLGLRRVKKKEIFPPATPVEVHVKNIVSFGASVVSSEEKVFFYLVASDSVTENPAGSGRYDHDLSLVEPTKYAEMIVCNTQTVTNDIGRVYTANQVQVTPQETEG